MNTSPRRPLRLITEQQHHARPPVTEADAERLKSADACRVAAGVMQSLGEALGPHNDHSAAFLEWASRLASQERRLRAKPGR
jgi:hypothetical protein